MGVFWVASIRNFLMYDVFPKGTFLGPLLLLVYINDMPLQSSSKLLLFADDEIYWDSSGSSPGYLFSSQDPPGNPGKSREIPVSYMGNFSPLTLVNKNFPKIKMSCKNIFLAFNACQLLLF